MSYDVYEVLSWRESGYGPLDGSFSQYPASDGGVTARLRLARAEIDFIKGINSGSEKSWKWAADAPGGRYYQSVPGYSIDEGVDWNWVSPASCDPQLRPGERNYVAISGFIGSMGQIIGAPRGIDYSVCLSRPEFLWTIYGNYGAMPPLWKMIPLSPSGGFQTTKSNRLFQIPIKYLGQKIRTVADLPWPVTPPIVPPVTDALYSVMIGTGAALSLRPSAGVNNTPVGQLYNLAQFSLQKTITDGLDVWGLDGNGNYLALYLRGRYYTTWRK